ncbi:MAG: class I SAM-dependent methyltransferase [Desulfomonilaceae bacterium]
MAEHICPWWMGYVLASPIRRFLEKPEELVGPFLREGMTVMDYGCGMGFFTIPMAHMVGTSGKVLAVDIQEKMLVSLQRRARRARLSNIQLLTPHDLPHLPDHTVEFVAALHVVHEIPDPAAFFRDMARLMKPHGKILVVEPKFHVNETEFLKSIDVALPFGFTPTTERVCATRAQVLQLTPSPAPASSS